jgi:hypothetical protein
MNIRQAVKEMSSLGLVSLRYSLRFSTAESDIEFIKEIDEELKIRDKAHSRKAHK